jgi:hypothetical protein
VGVIDIAHRSAPQFFLEMNAAMRAQRERSAPTLWAKFKRLRRERHTGHPIAVLVAKKYEDTHDGHIRRVVTADLVQGHEFADSFWIPTWRVGP